MKKLNIKNKVKEQKDNIKNKIDKEVQKHGLKTVILSAVFIGLIAIASLCLIFALYIIISAPNFDKDKLYAKEATVIYDINGEELAKIGNENRSLVSYEDLPQVFIDALIATEDSRFFQHNGLDIARFIKASIGQVLHSSTAGGASTITMQLIKNTYTDSTAHGIKGIIRKFTDIYMAVFKVENCYTKEEILEFYVNSFWLGNDGNLNYSGIYGVEEASQLYFGKSVKDLTLAESSLLVGMFQNARLYNPYRNPVGCRNRQRTVLKLMVNHGYITQDEADAVLEIPVESLLAEGYGNVVASNEYQAIIDYILEEVEKETHVNPYSNPMKIYSTIDPKVADVLVQLNKGDLFKFYNDDDQIGVAIVSVEDGSVVAISGGRNYQAKGTNRAIDLDNQPGSTAKPIFDYAPYIEYLNGSTGDYFFDEEYKYSTGDPISNSDDSYKGIISLRDALMGSRNIPALQAFQKVAAVDKSYISNLVESLNIHYGSGLYESASIGGFNGMSPLEMASAYSMFARGGYYIEPYVFTKVVFEDKSKYEHKYTKNKVLSEETCYMITNVLMDVATKTTDAITVQGTQIAAKTGTTNIDAKSAKLLKVPESITPDVWFSSYSPEYAISLWYGYDTITPEHYVTVNTGWNARRKIMNAIATRVYSTNKTFTQPSGVVSVEVEKETIPLQLASEFTPEDMKTYELFKEGTEPTEVSTRYARLENVSNLKYEIKDNKVTLKWEAINTPNAIDNNYLQEYFNDNYGQWASKYYEKRITDNANQFGSLGYRIYTKDSVGNLTPITWVSSNTYTQSIEPNTEYTFVVKSEYSSFASNASSGTSIKVDTSDIIPGGEIKED